MRAATAALLVQTPFLEVDVAELLFEGYADPFLDQVIKSLYLSLYSIKYFYFSYIFGVVKVQF